ncbi:MAG TPA: hypothetical protein VJ124_23445 [Pyrinomonadaceae bacterium]|nr:hypothetical protein [Pyrinomonadaceae bacterium]
MAQLRHQARPADTGRPDAAGGQSGRQLAYVEGEETTDLPKRNVQRPRVFYRRELETQPFVVARMGPTQ